MRRIRLRVIPLMVLAVLLAAATPASGRPTPPPKDDPVVVDVTMTLVNGEGLTTDCDDGDGIAGSIKMIKNGTDLTPAMDPVLGVYMNDVVWQRIYPDPIYGSSGVGFRGCHRMLLDPDEPDSVYGGLMISLDGTGAVTDLLWHFDYWYVWGVRGKRVVVTDFEQFTLSADESTLRWVDNTPEIAGDTNGTLTAMFGMAYHHMGLNYLPLSGSPREMSFTIRVVPRA